MKNAHVTVALLALASFLLIATHGHAADERAKVTTVKLAIEGMCCTGCLTDIEQSLTAVAGVQSAKATFEPPEATVTFDAKKTTAKALITAIGKVGYGAKVKPSTKKRS